MLEAQANDDAFLSLQEQAYRAIRARIVTCRIPPGSILNEGQVASMIGLGRTPVHQAFDRLRLEGLVTVQPRRGVMVRGIELGEMLEIIEARLVNECHVAGLAAMRATPADIAALEENLLRSGGATGVKDTERLMLLEQEFHGLIADMAGNEVLATFLANLRDRAIRFWYVASGREPHRQLVVAQHADIVQAIARADRAGAEAAMARHLEDLRQSVLRERDLPG
ncbi:GntR family transcriptional regulator [Acetobacteraceae bacterium H6797]|nr:GntR family transcriptional regulator [Acetobacteraceae bacterium H6797]